jgi:hypothetical protein
LLPTVMEPSHGCCYCEGVPIGNESLKPTVDSKCRSLRTPIWESASTSPRQSWNTSKTIWSVALTCQVFRRKSPKDERMTSTTVGAHDGSTSCWSIYRHFC